MALREALREHQLAVQANPESKEAKAAFDRTAEQLCDKLCELDRWVADSVVEQVTDAFVETSAPIDHLVQAATATPTPSPPVSGICNSRMPRCSRRSLVHSYSIYNAE